VNNTSKGPHRAGDVTIDTDEVTGVMPTGTAAALAGAETVKSRSRSGIRWLLAIAAVGGAGAYWHAHADVESTDDAQVEADLTAVPARAAGTVKAIHFHDNEPVRAGQLLAELDDQPAQARLAQAEASLAAAEAAAHVADLAVQLTQTNAKSSLQAANAGLRSSAVGVQSTTAQIEEAQARVQNASARLAEADQNLQRVEALFRAGASAQAQLDQQRTQREVAKTELTRAQAARTSVELARDQAVTRVSEAQARVSQSAEVDALIREAKARAEQARAAVETARAQRTLAALELSYTKVYAPVDGVVSKRTINLGQNVSQGQGIVQLVPGARWVVANFKETQLARIRVGHPVTVNVDAYPGQRFSGSVESFSGATGSRFAVLPPDNASGNFTKVVQRVSVRIELSDLPEGLELRPGMSVEVEVDTDAASAAAHAEADRPRDRA
jgi:membrane fusion protein (multidrug efflux system)